MSEGEGGPLVGSLAALLGGLDLEPLRRWLFDYHAVPAGDVADDPRVVATALRALGVPEKLLPRAEDRASLVVSGAAADASGADRTVQVHAKELGFPLRRAAFPPAARRHQPSSHRRDVSADPGARSRRRDSGQWPTRRGADDHARRVRCRASPDRAP